MKVVLLAWLCFICSAAPLDVTNTIKEEKLKNVMEFIQTIANPDPATLARGADALSSAELMVDSRVSPHNEGTNGVDGKQAGKEDEKFLSSEIPVITPNVEETQPHVSHDVSVGQTQLDVSHDVSVGQTQPDVSHDVSVGQTQPEVSHDVSVGQTQPDITSSLPGTSTPAEQVSEKALTQVVSYLSDMSKPLSHDEKIAVDSGESVMAEVKKATEEAAHDHLDLVSLMQTAVRPGEAWFGIGRDGSIDADVAASQMTEVLSGLAGQSNPLSVQEKDVLHNIIGGFARVFSPASALEASLQTHDTHGIDKLATEYSSQLFPQAGTHDGLIQPQTLLSISNDFHMDKDMDILKQLADKFLDRVQENMKDK